jgi:hypothetical protein
MANVLIDIASEFTGKKAFNQADKATDKLSKNVKRLAGAFGLAFSTTAVLAYGKASVKAAAADQKAQQQLALALKNVGLERDAATSEALIQRLQSEYGIVDDLLRPAYQSLAIATRDTSEAQRLLNLSLDISAATGKDLGSVTTALSRAYLGNNTALSRLGVGISKADLKAKSFYEITTELQDTFKGSATAAANTFQGSMDKLGVASANVSEIIGTSLIDALKGLGDENSVDDLAASMERVAQRTGDIIRGVGVLINKLKQLPGMPDFSVLYDISYLRLLEKIGSNSRAGSAGGFPQGPPSDLTRQFPTQTAQTKVAKDTLKINKESLKLAKARAVFDLQKIQIEAALKGKLSEEDAIRLKLMKAILDENITDVDKYQKALEAAQKKTKELSDLLTAVKTLELKDPFSMWKVDPLTASINALTASINGVGTSITARGTEWSSFANTVATTVIRPNLSEWNSAFGAAQAAANAALSALGSMGSVGATGSTGATTTGGLGGSTTNALIAKAEADAAAAKAEATAAAAKVAELQATAAATKALTEEANAYAQRNAAIAAANAQAALDAALKALQEANAKAAAAATAAAANTPIAVTITGDPFTDPNAVAEKVVEIIRSASNRGTVDVLGFD